MLVAEQWFTCIVIAFVVLLLALIARTDQGSWFAPGAFFLLVWSFHSVLPLLIAPDVGIWPGTLLAIVMAAFAVYSGSTCGMGGTYIRPSQGGGGGLTAFALRGPQAGKERKRWPGLRTLTGLGTLSGCVGILVIVYSEGYDINDVIAPESLMAMAARFSIARYHEDYTPPLLAQFLTLGMYAGALFGGALFLNSQSQTGKLLAISPIFPAMMFTMVLTTRASLLFQIVLWVSAYSAARVQSMGLRNPLFTKKFLVRMLVLAPLLGCFFAVTLLLRSQEDWDGFQTVIWPRLRGDLIGHMAAFSEWVESSATVEVRPAWGALTFAGLFHSLGLGTRIQGFYAEVVQVGSDELASTTNIYTAFRGLVQDFTLPGALIVLFFIGLASGKAYRSLSAGNIGGVPILASFYTFTLWSHVVSFTAYNTLLGAYGVLGVYVLAVSLGKPQPGSLSFSRLRAWKANC